MLEPIVGNVELRKHTADEPTGGLRPRSASIIINNYNYGQFVGEAIESALEQTHPAQVIAVDDGSTDDSREIVRASTLVSSPSSNRTADKAPR